MISTKFKWLLFLKLKLLNISFLQIKEVLANAAREAGSTMEPILNEIAVDDMPPTYNRVNKYTAGFQVLMHI